MSGITIMSAEERAIKDCNESIRLAGEVGDNGTADLLEDLLKEEHLDEIQAQLEQIKQMGPQNYLVEQLH